MAKALRRRLHWTLIASLSLTLSACGEGSIQVASLPTDAIEVPAEVLREASNFRRPFATGTATVLYLHFDGLVIAKSNTSNSSSNASFIGGGTIPAFVGTQADRDQVVTLVKQLYAAYNISIVTARPTGGNYDMAVIGGRPSSLGLPYPDSPSGGVVGVAPMDCGSAMPRDIAFVFSDSIKSILPSKYVQAVAETTAHESAHTYGLPHSADACDLMSYGTCSKLKTFLDKSMGMQDASGNCSMSSMNSHQLLLKALGAATAAPPPADPPTTPPADAQAPAVTITSPATGNKVPTTATVTATITDDTGVAKAELLLDGALVATRSAAPYEFPVSLAVGQHVLTVNAYDAANNKGTASVTINVDASAPADPPAGTTSPTPPPQDAIPVPAAGTFGAACNGPADCSTGLCADDPNLGKYCTEKCDPDAAGCPGGGTCVGANGGTLSICTAATTPLSADADDSRLMGSCSFGAGPAGAASLWPILLGLGLLRLRRRPR
jgi:hypothetical protein